MIKDSLRQKVAMWLAPEYELSLNKQRKELVAKEAELVLEVNRRVADIVAKMDPFEPFFKKYHVVFSKEWAKPEDKLDTQSQLRLFQWAYGIDADPSFRYLVDWIRNTQGNATLRKAKNDNEWFYGRAAVVVVTLLVDEVTRLASHYRELMAKRGDSFDPHLPVEL